MDKLKTISPLFTKEYLNEKLSNWFNKTVEFIDAEFQDGATGKGDSYLSIVHRVMIYGKVITPKQGEDDKVSLRIILKRFPENIAIKKTFRSHTFFENEIIFYMKVMPVLLKFQSEKNIKDPFINLPRIFAAESDGINDFVAMEDLKVYNFTMPVRQEHMDSHHIHMILGMFAKFHGLSFAFKDQQPKQYEEAASQLKETYYDPKYWDWYQCFWKRLCRITLDALHRELPDTIYEEKVKKFAVDDTFKLMVKAAMDKRDSGVVSHGDSWTPNFLFQYENNVPTKAMMFDFQLARSASPVLDISFFLYTCAADKQYLNDNYDKFLQFYYDKLADRIRELGSDPDKVYSLDTFMKEVKELSYFGVGFAMESSPVIVLEPDEAMDMESLTGTEPVPIDHVWNLGPIKSKKGRQRLCAIFVHAIDKGYL